MKKGMLKVGKEAPGFSIKTTHGFRRLEDYRGEWLVLFTYSGDFNPICTVEVLAFARHYERFRERKCELLGLSLDTAEVHRHWVNHLRNLYGVSVDFPLGEGGQETDFFGYGSSYGLAPEIRSVACIDPQGILRCIQYCRQHCETSVSEVVRIVRSIQEFDRLGQEIPEEGILLPEEGIHLFNSGQEECGGNRFSEEYWFY